MKARLSETSIKALPTPETGQAFYRDLVQPALAVRVTANGSKAFVVEKRQGSKVIRVTLGKCTDMTTHKARELASEALKQIKSGNDPVQAKRDERARQARLAEVWADYLETRKHKWSDRHYRDHEIVSQLGGEARKRGKGTLEPGPLAPLMNVKLADLTAPKVESWLKNESQRRPTRAALAYRLLRACLNWAASHPDYRTHVDMDAVKARQVRDHVPRVRAKAGDVLQREQLEVWFREVKKIRNPVQSAYLQILLLTGARREELASLKWTDVDFQWNSLNLHDKVEGERTIPLTPYVATLLRDLKARNEVPPPRHRILNGRKIENDVENWKPSAWVFSSGTAKSGRIEEPRLAHNRALATAGLPPLSLHGLRRSFGTLTEWSEVPTGIVAQIMGHKPSAIAEKHYRRRPLDLLRMWHTQIEAWILNEAGIEQPTETEAGRRSHVRAV